MSDTDYAPPADEVASVSEIVASVNAAAPETPAAEPAAAEPTWGGPSQEQWDELVATNQQLVEVLYGGDDVHDVEEEVDDGLYDDEEPDLRALYPERPLSADDPRVEALADLVKAHTAEQVQRVQYANADRQALDILAEAGRALGVGKLDRDKARERAAELMEAASERYGFGPTAARAALIDAAAEQLPEVRSELVVAQRISMKAGLLARLEGR